MSGARMVSWFKWAWILLAFGGCAIVASVGAPHVGLGGFREEFFLYRFAGVTRTMAGVIGISFLICAASLMVLAALIACNVFASIEHLFLHFLGIALRSYSEWRDGVRSQKYNRRDQFFLLILAIPTQLVFLYLVPLAFECDAAAYFNFSPGSSYRPPIYPLFLHLTGQHLFHTFFGTVFVQGILGVCSVLLVYRILVMVSRKAAMVSALIYALSMVPFAAAKLMLAEQLFAFLVLSTLYFLSLYLTTSHRVFVVLTVLSGLAAMLTRWEGQVVLLGASVTLLLVGWSDRSRLLSCWMASLVIIVVTLTGWSGMRASFMNDARIFGTLQNGTGEQLFWRLYSQLDSRVYRAKSRFGSSFSTDPSGDEVDGFRDFRMVSPENGPSTAALREFILQVAISRPAEEIFNSHLIPGVEGGYLTRLGGVPERLVDEIFMSPNVASPGEGIVSSKPQDTYFSGIPMELRKEMGPVDADEFLMEVNWETMRNEPFVLVPFVTDAMSFLGIRLLSTIDGGRYILSSWGRVHYLNVGFDLGSCASNSLPPEMMAEYSWDQSLSEHRPFPVYAVVASAGRNFLRNVVGPLVLLTWWFMPFSRARPLLLTVGLASMVMVIIPGALGGGAYTRYEIAILPLLLIGTAGSIVALRDIIVSGRFWGLPRRG